MGILSDVRKFLVWLTGLASDNYRHCSAAAQRNVHLLGLAMLLTPTVSALLICLGVGTSFELNWMVTALLFAAWWLFIYAFDRTMVAAPKTGVAWTVGRLFVIFALTILHAIFFDTIFFDADLKARYQSDRQEVATAMDAQRRSESQAMLDSVANLHQNNQALSAKIAANLDSIALEGNGNGGSRQRGLHEIYYATERRKLEANEVMEAQRTDNKLAILQLLEMDSILWAEMESDKKALPKWETVGLLEKVRLLHQLSFKEADITVILFSVVWLLMVAAIELLPILAKKALYRHEYVAIQTQQSDNAIRLACDSMKTREMLRLEEHVRHLEEAARRQQRVEQDTMLREELGLVRLWLRLELDMIAELALEYETASHRAEEHFRELSQAAVKRAIERTEECFKGVKRPPTNLN